MANVRARSTRQVKGFGIMTSAAASIGRGKRVQSFNDHPEMVNGCFS